MSSEVKEKRFCKIAQPHSYVRFGGIGVRPNKQKTSDSRKRKSGAFSFVYIHKHCLPGCSPRFSFSYLLIIFFKKLWKSCDQR